MANSALLTRLTRCAVLIALCLSLIATPFEVHAQTPAIPPAQDIPPGFNLYGENAHFQLYGNPDSLAWKVIDRRSGYVWSSNLDQPDKNDRLNKTWRAFAQSGFSIDALDAKAAKKRYSITNAEHTTSFKAIDQGFQASVTFKEAGITVGVTVRLEEPGVSVAVPFSSIKQENPNYKLGLLYLYPFMGATREDAVPGYMFIPDGAGSLVRFTRQTKAKNMFYNRYYGADLGMSGEMPFDTNAVPPFTISLPVIGMAHGEKQNAYLAVVEKGASYGEIQAHPAGIITNFNFINNVFVYNESYFQATNLSGEGVTTLQPKTNEFDILVHYRFLTGAESDYVGMARSYQQYLVEKGLLKKSNDASPEIGIHLEFLGAEKEKVLFWDQAIPMTTISQMGSILDDLKIPNADVVYYGWQPLGATRMPPRSLQLEGSLGSVSQLRALIDRVNAGGGRFYLYLNPQAALVNVPGYSPRNDLAMSITDANILGYNHVMGNYYLNLAALTQHYQRLSSDIFAAKSGLALDVIGSMLYSDFKSGHFLNREQAIRAYQDLLAQTPGPAAFYRPNDYMFGRMGAYYDIPLSDSGYIYTDETVPFLQVVLSGYVPYYGPAMNFSSNARQDLLRMVDFGVYPSYYLTQEVTARILRTGSNWIYTSSYQQWGQNVKDTYRWMDNLLKPVKGQSIIAREALQNGVYATTYANGRQIIVNYTDQTYSAGGVVVKGQDAILREVAK